VTLSYDKSAAVVALPSLAGNRVTDKGLRRWLSRALVKRSERPRQLLESVLGALNLPYPDDGIAALRMWGQTGDRPTVWVAAADPVYLEPRLDHLCLHALDDEQLSTADLRTILDYLQETLAQNERFGFARIGSCGYLRSDDPLSTAQLPAIVIDEQLPDEFMPSGEESGSYRKLRSEVEMALHDHEVNIRRQSEGLQPINSLWLWGGGFAPEQETEPRPPLFGNDPLLKGCWLSKTAVVEEWPGSIAACLEASVAGFVAIPGAGEKDDGWIEPCLRELRAALRSGRISKLVLILSDGHEVHAKRINRWRFWRRSPALFGTPN
jgi:hypothetical protein